MANPPTISTTAAHENLQVPDVLRLNPTGEPTTPLPPRLRLHQVIKSFQGASIHQFIKELQQSSTQEDLHSKQQHQEWLTMVQPIYDTCIRTRESLNGIFALYCTLPYQGSSVASDTSSLFRFLWNLNFAARHVLLPGQQGIDPSNHNAVALPLACLNILLASTPLSSPILRKPFSDHAHFPYRTKNGAADILRCLVAASLQYTSAAFPTAEQKDLAHHIYVAAAKLTQAVDAFLAEILAPLGLHPIGLEELHGNLEDLDSHSQQQQQEHYQHQPSTSFSVAATADAIPFSGCRSYVGLVEADGKVSESTMHALNKYIDQVVCPNVDIDERVFLEEEREGEDIEDIERKREIVLPVQETVLPQDLQQQDKDKQQQKQFNVLDLGVIFQGHTIHTPPHPTKTRKLENQQLIPLPSEAVVITTAGLAAAGLAKKRDILSSAEALDALQWLQSIASMTNIQSVNEDLKSYGVDEATLLVIATFTASMLANFESVWKQSGGALQNVSTDPSKLQDLTLSLFYCTLKALLKAELKLSPAGGSETETATTTTHTASLIIKIASNAILIQCIMVLSLECVICSSQLPHFQFPASLIICNNAPAFAIARLLPPFFLSYQSTMPEGLKCHLLSVEEQIIEKYAWEEGSSLFDMLREATSNLVIEEERNPPATVDTTTPVPVTGTQDKQQLMQPPLLLPPRQLVTPEIDANPSNPAATLQAHNLLSAFIDKAVKLVTVRLSHLLFSSSGLKGQAQPSVTEFIQTGTVSHATTATAAAAVALDALLLQAVTAVDAILREHTWLLYGRHLDQIMMCVLYGLSKELTGSAGQGGESVAGEGAGVPTAAILFRSGFGCLIEAYIRCFGTDSVSQVNTLWIDQYLNSSGQVRNLVPPALPPPQQEFEQQPITVHIIQFYNTVFLPETHALLQAIVAGTYPLLPELPAVQLKTTEAPPGAPPPPSATAAALPPPLVSPWSHQNTRNLIFRGTPIRTNTGSTEFTMPSSISPGRAMKLSPGRWNVSAAGGTRLVSPIAFPIVEKREEEEEWQQEDILTEDTLETDRKRRKRERRKSGAVGTPAKGPYRPVDALLAVAADAEEELRRSTPSSSGTESPGSGD